MKTLRAVLYSAVLILTAAGLSGCFPAEDHLDEEKDSHFQRGRDLVNSQEFKAAADEFEKALENNPRSASAHYELGWLYDNKLNDFAAAIYHYQKNLALAPRSPHVAQVRERIRGCKLQLATTEFPLPNSQNLQQELEKLTDENRMLRTRLDAAATAGATVPAAAAPATHIVDSGRAGPAGLPAVADAAPHPSPAVTATGRPRVYVIQARDTITAVAARYGVKPSMVLAVNPAINPTRLRIGQSLNLP